MGIYFIRYVIWGFFWLLRFMGWLCFGIGRLVCLFDCIRIIRVGFVVCVGILMIMLLMILLCVVGLWWGMYWSLGIVGSFFFFVWMFWYLRIFVWLIFFVSFGFRSSVVFFMVLFLLFVVFRLILLSIMRFV